LYEEKLREESCRSLVVQLKGRGKYGGLELSVADARMRDHRIRIE
jgi:hypothetical protein